MIAKGEDTWAVWFDYLLEDLKGRCSAMVRLATYAGWSQQDEKEMHWRAFLEDETLGGASSLSPAQRTQA